MTIDTSREAVERLLDGVTPGPWKELSGANHRIMASYMCINGLSAMFTLARIDNPDDAERGYTDDAYNPDTAEANTRFIAAARELVPALMAERDAALAEVARLSTPPDDAEVLAIIKDVTFEAVNSEIDRVLAGRICQKLARLSHALAAEKAKREAMEAALTEIDALDPEHLIDSCAHTAMRGLVLRMGEVARATLAKHGSK